MSRSASTASLSSSQLVHLHFAGTFKKLDETLLTNLERQVSDKDLQRKVRFAAPMHATRVHSYLVVFHRTNGSSSFGSSAIGSRSSSWLFCCFRGRSILLDRRLLLLFGRCGHDEQSSMTQ